MKRLVLLVTVLLGCHSVYAQKFSVSTNLLGYAALGTLNADASYSVSRRWSVVVGARYNPFTFSKGDPERQFQLRQQSCYVGARLWPWHALSGWWFSSKIRYQEYNSGGIVSRETREGDRAGLGLYAGYTHFLSTHFIIDFGS